MLVLVVQQGVHLHEQPTENACPTVELMNTSLVLELVENAAQLVQ
jgi:hypothetical protein